METPTLESTAIPAPEIHTINGVEYITGPDAATYLECHYSTVINLVNNRNQYLKANKIGATLFITWESAQREKERRAGLEKAIVVVQQTAREGAQEADEVSA